LIWLKQIFRMKKFLSYYPLKQGLKRIGGSTFLICLSIFILLSIKTRIETDLWSLAIQSLCWFLSYYPLKQGLKQSCFGISISCPYIFILLSIKTRIETYNSVLLIVKDYFIFILLSIKTRIETHLSLFCIVLADYIFILLSIKTRIETIMQQKLLGFLLQFLSYYPLKQGLKLHLTCGFQTYSVNFYPTIH